MQISEAGKQRVRTLEFADFVGKRIVQKENEGAVIFGDVSTLREHVILHIIYELTGHNPSDGGESTFMEVPEEERNEFINKHGDEIEALSGVVGRNLETLEYIAPLRSATK
jgi:hypothetical protein